MVKKTKGVCMNVKNYCFTISILLWCMPHVMTADSSSESFGTRLGEAMGYGIAQTVHQVLHPPKPKQKPYQSKQTQQEVDFIKAIFEGKKVAIPYRALNAIHDVKLNKAPFNTTALMAAVAANNNTMMQYLLESEADPDIQNKDGLTALHIAARNGNKQQVAQLLLYEADPNLIDKNGMTPLMYAVMRNRDNDHLDVINLLLAHGADPNLISNKGSTALMLAVINNGYDVVATLLQAGADQTIKNLNKQTAYDLAKDSAMKRLLLFKQISDEDELLEEEEFIPVFGHPVF